MMQCSLHLLLDMRDVYIIGAKGIGQYGGYETFVQNLIDHNRGDIRFHVACKANGEGAMDLNKLSEIKNVTEDSFEYKDAKCFLIRVPELGPAQAIIYDLMALGRCIRDIEKNEIKDPVVYILACRIGPFFKPFVRKIHRLKGLVQINPDGHEWKRAKWSKPIRKYWKFSERLMVKYADLVICDSVNIEKYIKEEYSLCKPETAYISYGSSISKSSLSDDDQKYQDWLKKHGLKPDSYYLSVGRFVPENNFETMISEFMKSKTDRDFALITNVNERFMEQLKEKLHFDKDPRIKFVGAVYDPELLKKIRENAYAYFHGHEVGGTNPSLLEALGSTDVNLLYDVGFNREVAEDAARYWNKEDGDLAGLIDNTDRIAPNERKLLGGKAKRRIAEHYSWDAIVDSYRELWNDQK